MLITVTRLDGIETTVDTEQIAVVSWHPNYTELKLKSYLGDLRVVNCFEDVCKILHSANSTNSGKGF